MSAPQNKFGLDGPVFAPMEFAFEFWSLVFYAGMFALLMLKMDLQSFPAKIAIAALGAWAAVASFCAIGLISTLGFADGSEASVFSVASFVTLALVVISGIFASLTAMRNMQKQNHG